MRNKKLMNRRNDIAQGWQFCTQYRLGKGREKKQFLQYEKYENENYYLLL